jgi:dCTP deaminase
VSVLPDWVIRDESVGGLIVPYNEDQLQAASYDIRLDDELLIPIINGDGKPRELIDLGKPLPDFLYEKVIMGKSGWVLGPHDFVLGVTKEHVNIPTDIVGRIEGKSSIGRLGLTAHVTAGYIDPGFRGRVTLEIVNLFPRAILIRPGVFIAQLGFEYMSANCERPYGSAGLRSRYQDSDGVQGSRLNQRDS